jgi:curved DNA-binding protein CbpA
MEASNFVDYYETLEISPNANSGTIERMFRYFAQRYHPDNRETGDRARFDTIMEAYNVLNDPGKRTEFDVKRKNNSDFRKNLLTEASDNKGLQQDVDLQNKLLSIFYVRRRQDIANPGIGDLTLERMVGCPVEHLQFHLWYLKEKGWIRKTESGMFAITVDGVDQANSAHHGQTASKRLLTDQTALGHAAA